MKRDFLYGIRGRAAGRFNRALLAGALGMFILLRIARSDWSNRFAASVPVGFKCLAGIALLFVTVHTCRQIYCGLLDRALPRVSPFWLAVEAALLFTFAVVSADSHFLFSVGALLWVATVFGTKRYYECKWKQLRRARTRI